MGFVISADGGGGHGGRALVDFAGLLHYIVSLEIESSVHAMKTKELQKFERSKHRNLFIGDVTFLFQNPVYNSVGGPYSAKIFHDWIDLIADSGVDTYLCNPNA